MNGLNYNAPVSTQVGKNRWNKARLRDFAFVGIFAFMAETEFSFHVLGQKVCMLVVALVGLAIYLSGRKLNITCCCIYRYLLIAAFPFLFALFHAIIVVSINNQYNLSIISQAFTSTGFAFVQMMFVGVLIIFYKGRAIDVSYYIIVVSYGITIICELSKHTISSIISNYNTIYNYFERHDIGVSVVSIIIYYLYKILVEKEHKKKYNRRLIIMILIMLMCGKRSALLSIGVAVFVMVVISLNLKDKYKFCKMMSIMMVILLYVYVVLIQTNAIVVICNKLGISTQGRIDVWSWFSNQYDITPMYFGKGFQYIHKYMTAYIAEDGNPISMISMFGYLHNSDLQIFIELGFLGFFLWFLFYLSWYPNKIKKCFGLSTYYLCYVLMISMVIMYMADNTLTYPLYQTTTYCAIFTHAFLKKKEKISLIK